MKRSFILMTLAIAILGLSACKTKQVSINAIRPAEVNIPNNIQTLVLVDRSQFDPTLWTVLEGIITGELPGEDHAAAQQTLNSVAENLRLSPRFTTKFSSVVLKGNSPGASFPPAISWNKVEKICADYNAEALLAIEIFDSDFIITKGSNKTKKTITENGVKREIEVDEFYAEGVANLTIGFRIYDPANKTIVDQQLFTRTNTWCEKAGSMAEATAKLINKANATRHMGQLAGQDYAYKIAPMPVRLTRNFYKKMKNVPEVAAGARMAEVNNWTGAIKMWEAGLDHSNTKAAGRLCMNIAVGYEVLGQLEMAQQWAGHGYAQYGNKQSRSYAQVLSRRIVDEQVIDQQMSKPEVQK